MANTHPYRQRVSATPGSDAALFKLFSVTITHTFYTRDDGVCPDFTAQPTPSTQALMTRFGIRLRAERAGFSLYLPEAQRAAFLAWVFAAPDATTGAPEYWARLTFALTLHNPLFVGITELPLETITSTRNLYGSNTEAHRSAQGVILSPGAFMDGGSLLPLVGKIVRLSLPPGASRVVVKDIAGVVVIPAGRPPAALHSARADASYALVDFGTLPFGRYTIAALGPDGGTVAGYPRTVLYTDAKPDALLLLDMLLTQPTPSHPGLYPVRPGVDGVPPGFVDVGYRLPFAARRTLWRYFVVDQAPGGTLRNLQIKGRDCRFVHDGEARLPTGATARVFTGETPLALSQHSSFDFQLTGRRRDADGHENPLRIARLPVAASTPVWPPATPGFASGVSEIFVYI